MSDRPTTGLASMTGYGEARSESKELSVAVELRTVNNRHYRLSFRASENYGSLESEVDRIVRQGVRRGTVQVNLRVMRKSSFEEHQIQAEVLLGYHRQLEKIGVEGAAIPLDALLSLPGVVAEGNGALRDPHKDWPAIEPVLREAVESTRAMRIREGESLCADLKQNCELIGRELTGIADRAPLVSSNYREKLTDRVNKALSELNVTVEPSDLIREVALFADRCDISEEVVRLQHHVEQFLAAIEATDVSGRKLEFISQEMGRETNTIGSKANDTLTSNRVVEIKTALERIREQVQNVE